MSALLHVQDLHIDLRGRGGTVSIVDGINFEVKEGTVFGLAGESGCGKTMTALSVMGLLPGNVRASGGVHMEGRNLLELSSEQIRHVRGRKIGMVFQDPTSSLHPMLSIEHQLTEHALTHMQMDARQARRRAIQLLEEVRIPDPEAALRSYPHQFSGGMRQRIQIAMALMCEPELLIADEPTTALDVTVQAGILRLIDRLRRTTGMAVILITHDLGVLSALADSVTVMYAGRVVEAGPTVQVLQQARHPYTRGLLDSLPHLELADQPLIPIPGTPPGPAERPGGCAFHPRCPHAVASCMTRVPTLLDVTPGRSVACPVDPFASERVA